MEYLACCKICKNTIEVLDKNYKSKYFNEKTIKWLGKQTLIMQIKQKVNFHYRSLSQLSAWKKVDWILFLAFHLMSLPFYYFFVIFKPIIGFYTSYNVFYVFWYSICTTVPLPFYRLLMRSNAENHLPIF